MMLLYTSLLYFLLFRFSEPGTVHLRHRRESSSGEPIEELRASSGDNMMSISEASGDSSGAVTDPLDSSGDPFRIDPGESSGEPSGSSEVPGDASGSSSGSGVDIEELVESSGESGSDRGSGEAPAQIVLNQTEVPPTRDLSLAPLPDLPTSTALVPSSEFTCEPDEYKCPGHNSCIFLYWVCDGRQDCPHGTDEENCDSNPQNYHIRDKAADGHCSPEMMSCEAHNPFSMCVPRGFWCDREYDCEGGQDEYGCESPSILRDPADYMEVEQGDTFHASCVAAGKPPPVIIWRLNWGHVDSRAVMTTNYTSNRRDVQGEIQIHNVVCEHAGAYSCEAINAGTRVFAKDVILAVRGC